MGHSGWRSRSSPCRARKFALVLKPGSACRASKTGLNAGCQLVKQSTPQGRFGGSKLFNGHCRSNSVRLRQRSGRPGAGRVAFLDARRPWHRGVRSSPHGGHLIISVTSPSGYGRFSIPNLVSKGCPVAQRPGPCLHPRTRSAYFQHPSQGRCPQSRTVAVGAT